jgi:meiotically up-regulated gene 157 (Mug157) protein
VQDGTRVYAYEVDGLGNSLVDFDDPNIPSLLAIPELGYDGYDKEVSPCTCSISTQALASPCGR